MKRVLMIFIVLAAVITLAAAPALAQQKKAEPAKKAAEFQVRRPHGGGEDQKKGTPFILANWMVVAGPDASLERTPSEALRLPLMISEESSSAIRSRSALRTPDVTRKAVRRLQPSWPRIPRLSRPSAPTAPVKPGPALRFCESRHCHGVSFQHGPLPDRPEAGTRVQWLPAHGSQR